MVNDAEKYKAEDEVQKDRIAAKNQLESYAYNMKSTVEDDKLKDKISADDLKVITDKCSEVGTMSFSVLPVCSMSPTYRRSSLWSTDLRQFI